MIAKDQPKIFKNTNLQVRVSSTEDGQMNLDHGVESQIIDNIALFVPNNKHVLVRCTYTRPTFDEIQVIDASSTMWNSTPDNRYNVDAFVTNTSNITLSIPVADCLCLVMFDPIAQALGIAHLGRHGTVDNLAEKLVSVMINQYKCHATNLLCYLSPSIKLENYGLDYFDKIDDPQWSALYKSHSGKIFIDIPGYNVRKLLAQGIPKENIEISTIDTATDPNYGSHYMHERDKTKSNFRFLVSATISETNS